VLTMAERWCGMRVLQIFKTSATRKNKAT
jgi:hypothetical protein